MDQNQFNEIKSLLETLIESHELTGARLAVYSDRLVEFGKAIGEWTIRLEKTKDAGHWANSRMEGRPSPPSTT